MHKNETGSGARTPDTTGGPARLSVALLQAENRRLREQLDGLIGEARLNQDKLRRFDQLERKVIGAASLVDLVQTLLVDYPALFELDCVTLALVDAQYEVARILGEGGVAQPAELLLLHGEQPLQQLYGVGTRPLLGEPTAAHDFLFDGASATPGSVALLPLVHRGAFIGSLNLGSRDAARFATGSSTDFLERLAALVAVCLDSALATERLKLAGLTDGLTGVHNRRYFEARCLEEVQAARRSKLPLVCLLLDVDHFKRINDTHGHPAGDAVLRYVARLIRAQLRGSDVVARYGGEEFVMLLPATPLAAALDTAERIRRVIAAQSMPVQVAEPLRITVSIGAALLPPEAEVDAAVSAAALVQRADQALYAAKQGGRNRVLAAD
ncbi:MAG: sensor domain-containing diguanylate cyclase [Hylemonella sp.]|nr:sensor domain-containing diguanylate cyclase [Hylemonella sp.]